MQAVKKRKNLLKIGEMAIKGKTKRETGDRRWKIGNKIDNEGMFSKISG